ncbi:MAG: hypothetical protein M5U28_10730 [Sandaracinaceae bacterium]|nr:hypothetical protein [Sandaracinaceae bacterium]
MRVAFGGGTASTRPSSVASQRAHSSEASSITTSSAPARWVAVLQRSHTVMAMVYGVPSAR